MPFYEYECASCKFYTEVLQRISDRPLRKCPSCGRNTLVKLVSAPVFRLKGAGWYETDFKSDKEMRRNLAEAEKGESKDSSPADAGKKPEAQSKGEGESKPAAVSETKTPSAQPTPTARPRAARSHARTSTPHRTVKPKSVRPGASPRARAVRKAR